MIKHYDFAIVGQGIAGTLLHFLLSKHQLKGLVIDKGHEHAASKVASGLINPITGRKYVKSWMFDELKMELDKVYRELEQFLNIEILKDHGIVRVLSSIKDENQWYSKATLPGYEKYFIQDVDSSSYKDVVKGAASFGEVDGGAKVDLSKLITAYREYLKKEELLEESNFAHDQLVQQDEGIWTDGKSSFDKIIFCEGWQLKNNPFFENLGQEAAKGEVLIIRLEGVQLLKSIKKRIFITPLQNDLYWVGSTYQWEFENDKPTDEKREYLIKALDEMLDKDYEIVDHWAGIRPTTQDRRPLIGKHPNLGNMFVFSGLGTKGASLAPYWAQVMVEYILHNIPIPEEVDIVRHS